MKKICLIVCAILCCASVANARPTTDVYKDQGGDRQVIADGGTCLVESGGDITLESGATLELEAGATFTVADGLLAPGDIAIIDASMIIGQVTGFGAAKAITGDVDIANTGVATIAEGSVEDTMLEALAAGEFFIGVDGTAANNAIVIMSGDATMGATGAVDVAATFTQNLRDRVTVAEIIAGHELLAAISGSRYRIISAKAIAYGGACGTTTTVDILGTVSAGSVKLVAYAQASLTQSAVLTDGGSGAAVLADGASYVSMDANTGITIDQTGGDVDTCTGVDILLTYVIE